MRGSLRGSWKSGLCAALVGLVLAAPCASRAAPSADFDARARQVLQAPGYQRDLPGVRREPGRPGVARAPSRPAPDGGMRVSSGASSLASVVGWTLLLVVGALLLVALARAMGERWALRGGISGSASSEGGSPARSAASAAGSPWHALAEQGRHDEAVHRLLLVALERVAIAGQGRALTSREVLERARLSPERASALEELIAAVERSLFGGAALGRSDYDRCLLAFDRFGRGAT